MTKFLTTICIVCLGFAHQTKWELKKDADGIQVYTGASQESKFKRFKAITNIKAVPQDVAKIITDVEHNSTWVQNVKPGKIVKRFSENEFLFTQEIEMPFPFTNRFMIQRCVTTTFPDGSVRVDMTDENDAFKYDGDLVVIPISKGYWLLKPNGNTSDLEYSFLVDPGGNIPAWVVNSFLVDNPFNSTKNLKTLLAKKG